MEKKIEIYTDGACKGNPGIGGWGALLLYNEHKKEICGYEEHTTNNRMELTAAIKAFQALKQKSNVIIHTDSKYLKNGITSWIYNWKKNGWKTKDKKPIKNVELWKILDEEVSKHIITWKWVEGHSGNNGNEKADELANIAIKQFLSKKIT